jgi:hypothetical protein
MEKVVISFGYMGTPEASIFVGASKSDLEHFLLLLKYVTSIGDSYKLAYCVGVAIRAGGYSVGICEAHDRGHFNIFYDRVTRQVTLVDVSAFKD